MKENTLLPVRIKNRGDHVVGDEAKTLTRDSGGFTRSVVWATAESILKCDTIKNSDLHKIAGALDAGYLEFDSYSDEYDSRFGRPVLEMIRDDGIEAYEAIQDQLKPNPYLHAALYGMDVWEASEELDVTPNMVVQTNDGYEEYDGGWSSPDVVAAATIGEDGEIYDMDLRTFEPDLEWVIDNWKATGGNRSHTRKLSNTEDDEETLAELAADEVEGHLQDSVVRPKDRTVTVHHVREKEEAITENEVDRLVMFCGSPQGLDGTITRLKLDTGRIEDRHVCGNCARYAEPESADDAVQQASP